MVTGQLHSTLQQEKLWVTGEPVDESNVQIVVIIPEVERLLFLLSPGYQIPGGPSRYEEAGVYLVPRTVNKALCR